MSRSGGGPFPSSAATPGSIFFAKEMPASKKQVAEASKDTGVSKICPLGNKIRIRLPPRKRLAELTQTTSTVGPDDTKNHLAEVSEHTDNSTPSTTLVDTNVKAEEVRSEATGEGQCEEANSNILIKTLSKDTLSEDVNLIVSSLNLTTATEPQVKEEINCSLRKEVFEEGNKNILHSEVERNNSSNIIPSNRLIYETNRNSPSKGLIQDAKVNNERKNLTISSVKGEEENGKSLGSNLFEEARKNIMSTEAINCCPSKRPADPANDKKSSKKPRTSVVHMHAAGTSQSTSGMKLSTSVDPAVKQSTRAASLEATKEYKEFEEKVKRTVYLDNLSPLATDAVIMMALNQFGNVKNVNCLTNYTVPFDIPQSALVEMETEKDAEHVVNMLHEFPFMVSGMPRPVRARRATAEMFNDRPRKPGKKLEFCWVDPTGPDCHDLRKFKIMSKRHEVENLILIKNQLQEEAMLAKHQQENLNCDYRKLESIDSVIMTGWADHLTRIYNFSFNEMY